ncbi:TetR/AcrR family transcriptional regulator [Patulibacter sp. SYSU D01012]|uniref:TetR/AcrR family transcriptional regulator n=1 Tax=Patulibacter sp. SYSU D01012 TaxID=2817381 RepID=UPI001B317546|nr:TetR/AcrR family transcriptional regulator [Patulibacter sp. SYSU D01012]
MPGPARTRLTHEERRAGILDAAGRVIVDRGVHAFRIQDVADAAGVSQPLVSAHFSSRDELIAAAFLRADERALADVVDELAALPPGRERIVRFVHSSTLEDDQQTPDGRELWHQLWTQARFSPVVQDVVRDRQAAWIALLTDVLAEARQTGDAPAALDPARAAVLLMAVVDGLTAPLRCGIVTDDEAVAVLDDAVGAILAG